ncbi:acetylxylan esterase [Streptomyces virginiae]
MPLTDLDLDELVRYRPGLSDPTDFDAFWRRTLPKPGRTAG